MPVGVHRDRVDVILVAAGAVRATGGPEKAEQGKEGRPQEVGRKK